MFKALKSSGFNIEKTHLQDIERVEKLVSLVFIAFSWCYKAGVYVDMNEQKIKIKKTWIQSKKSIQTWFRLYFRCIIKSSKSIKY